MGAVVAGVGAVPRSQVAVPCRQGVLVLLSLVLPLLVLVLVPWLLLEVGQLPSVVWVSSAVAVCLSVGRVAVAVAVDVLLECPGLPPGLRAWGWAGIVAPVLVPIGQLLPVLLHLVSLVGFVAAVVVVCTPLVMMLAPVRLAWGECIDLWGGTFVTVP